MRRFRARRFDFSEGGLNYAKGKEGWAAVQHDNGPQFTREPYIPAFTDFTESDIIERSKRIMVAFIGFLKENDLTV